MAKRLELSDDDRQYIKERYWYDTYEEIGEELGYSVNTIRRRAQNVLGLPSKTEWNRVEYQHAVEMERILYHLHHSAEMSVNRMSDSLGVARTTLDDWFQETGVHKRGQSEAEKLKWEQMTEEERRKQVEAAHEVVREKYERGEGALQRWFNKNPEEAREHARKVAALGAPAREENGMLGATGQEHPNWRGGKSVYDAVKKQLPGPSWNTLRHRHLAEQCCNCGSTDDLELHHVVPIMAGGTNEVWNFATLCMSCHHKAEWYTRDLLDPLLTC